MEESIMRGVNELRKVKYRKVDPYMMVTEQLKEGYFHQWAKDGTMAIVENAETKKVECIYLDESELIFIHFPGAIVIEHQVRSI